MMPDWDGPAPFLTFAKFRFHLRVKTLMVLPPYKGAIFRGAFGSTLRRLVCVSSQADCQSCLLRQRCLYMALFDPHPPSNYANAGKFQKAPRPYVLNPPLTYRRSFRPGETLEFELVLIGPAIDALPYFIHIFTEMGRQGLGRERGKYELLRVDLLQHGAPHPVYELSTRTLTSFDLERGPVYLPEDDQVTSVTLQFLTPLRLKEKGDLVTRLTFPLLFHHLIRRLSLLEVFYGSNGYSIHTDCNQEENLMFPALSLLADQMAQIHGSKNDLHWFDWKRYSRRQDSTMKFGGLLGQITFSGNLAPFLPYLRLGEVVNLGQATTFGLGCFCLR